MSSYPQLLNQDVSSEIGTSITPVDRKPMQKSQIQQTGLQGLILFRWFSPLERLVSSNNNELPKNGKQWKRFSVAEMVDDLFSEIPATRSWALRQIRQLVVDFPDRFMFNVLKMKTSPRFVDGKRIFDRNRWLKTALASVILQFEHPIAAFGSEFTPMIISQLSYPDPETVR
ncbi:unnamed protein product [Calicophoron daubneyi]|uniref:Uncharacterized protein n=1 Tax=Calicophoron daubneyi TaxID=300641 RepID=A0AAV2T6T9_CALDB